MVKRFDMKLDKVGESWTVFEISTGRAVVFEGIPQVGLLTFEAKNLLDLLETLDLRQRRAGKSLRVRDIDL